MELCGPHFKDIINLDIKTATIYYIEYKKEGSACSQQSEAAMLTMSDFHNFGLIFMRQRLKSTLFEIFSNAECEKISNNVDFSL